MSGWFSGLLLAAGILYFLYVACCGINYYRTSFSESSGIVAEEYTVGELTEVCQWLMAEVNDLSSQVERDDDGIMRADDGVQERAVKAMQALGETYPELSGYYPTCCMMLTMSPGRRSGRDWRLPWNQILKKTMGSGQGMTAEWQKWLIRSMTGTCRPTDRKRESKATTGWWI